MEMPWDFPGIKLTGMKFIVAQMGDEMPPWLKTFPKFFTGKEYCLTLSVRSFLKPENGIQFCVHVKGQRSKRIVYGSLSPSNGSSCNFVNYNTKVLGKAPYGIVGNMFLVKDHTDESVNVLCDLFLQLEGNELAKLENKILLLSTGATAFINKPRQPNAGGLLDKEKKDDNKDGSPHGTPEPGPSSRKY